jgi:hypothetical protein
MGRLTVGAGVGFHSQNANRRNQFDPFSTSVNTRIDALAAAA